MTMTTNVRLEDVLTMMKDRMDELAKQRDEAFEAHDKDRFEEAVYKYSELDEMSRTLLATYPSFVMKF